MKRLLAGRWGRAGLKLGFLLLVGLWLGWQVDGRGILKAVSGLPPWVFLASCLLLIGAQLASAARMRIYAADKGLPLRFSQAATLYAAGMFYNSALPGSIGGDGYKIWKLNRLLDLPTADGIRLILAERASGLLILLLLFFPAFGCSRFASLLPGSAWLLPLAAAVTLWGYLTITPVATRESRRASLRAAGCSLLVQGLGLLSALVLWQAMPLKASLADVTALTLLASVAAILPVSIGGLGMRELIFFSAAPYALDSAESMLGLSLLCSAAYLLVALLAGLALLWMPRQDWHLRFQTDAFGSE